jgi:hypothetical protein
MVFSGLAREQAQLMLQTQSCEPTICTAYSGIFMMLLPVAGSAVAGTGAVSNHVNAINNRRMDNVRPGQ